MRKEDIFIGNINRCTKYQMEPELTFKDFIGTDIIGNIKVEGEIYYENVILLKVDNYNYIILDDLESLWDYIKVITDYKINKLNSGYTCIMNCSPFRSGDLYVDEDSLKHYYDINERENISFRSLKKELKSYN